MSSGSVFQTAQGSICLLTPPKRHWFPLFSKCQEPLSLAKMCFSKYTIEFHNTFLSLPDSGGHCRSFSDCSGSQRESDYQVLKPGGILGRSRSTERGPKPLLFTERPFLIRDN